VYLINFTTPGTKKEDCPQNRRARQGIQYSIFENKITEVNEPNFRDVASQHFVFLCQSRTGVGTHVADAGSIHAVVLLISVMFVFWMKQTMIILKR